MWCRNGATHLYVYTSAEFAASERRGDVETSVLVSFRIKAELKRPKNIFEELLPF
jgi:hypothetical protein